MILFDTEPDVDVAEDDDCMILYTSGTTGLAKGALFDHHRLLWVGHSVTTLGERPDATGRWPIPNCEVRIVTADGRDAETGEAGEIRYRGETIMKSYWNQPEATAETIRDGWLHSGDVAIRDADGFITIVDRIKDMIITGGRNVYSVGVESALAGHPDIADVAIISRPDDTYGETIIAVVTPVEGHEVTLDDVRTFAGQEVSDYKLPRELIVRPIPRNPSGKILKHVLRRELNEEPDSTG